MTKTFTVDRFLGLNAAGDGTTELQPGEAAVVENFRITDAGNLKTRPGATAIYKTVGRDRILNTWYGMIGTCLWQIVAKGGAVQNQVTVHFIPCNAEAERRQLWENYGTQLHKDHPIIFFSFADRLWLLGTDLRTGTDPRLVTFYDDGTGIIHHEKDAAYVPLILTGCAPGGGGTTRELLNLLCYKARIQFSADGEATRYIFPSNIMSVEKIWIDNVEQPEPDDLTIGPERYYEFASPPPKGVNNVEFLCVCSSKDHIFAADKLLRMRHCEAYNGSTDTRLFFYGDGTNVCYYTGSPAFGEGLYIPAGNEIAVDSSASAVTGLCRFGTRLMCYKVDSTFTIDYEPVTLEDGRVIAGFYVHPASRTVGNDMDGQIQTVNNWPRTFCAGTLYEWRSNASYHRDERYAKPIAQKIAPYLRAADPTRIVTCDDEKQRTYYMFLNDEAGTVLVEHYDLDAWTVYTGEVFKNIRFALSFHGDVRFGNDSTVFAFDQDSAYDRTDPEDPQGLPIRCIWESGFLSFGGPHLRKESSELWISMMPEEGSRLEVTATTDRRECCAVKRIGLPLLCFHCIDFSDFSFLHRRTPKLLRIRLKARRFVWHKLTLRTTTPGDRATVLGYTQTIRYSHPAK